MGQGKGGALWRCKSCGEILGAETAQGRLWLIEEAMATAERYENATRVQCKCGRANLWHRTRGRAHGD